MLKKLILLTLTACSVGLASSCNHNKIACPTYADSFPEQKQKKKSPDKPQLPKATKAKSSVMPGGTPRPK